MKVRMLLLLFVCTISIDVFASDPSAIYLLTEQAQQIKYEGSLKVGEDTKTLSQTLIVKEPYTEKESGKKLTVHEITVNTAGKEQTKWRWYSLEEDGIYICAESSQQATDPKLIAKPSLFLPLPPTSGKTWDSQLQEDNKKINLKSKIVSDSEIVTIGSKEYTAIHIFSEGNAKVMGLEIPITREIWIAPGMGIIKQTSTQLIQGVKALTELSIVAK